MRNWILAIKSGQDWILEPEKVRLYFVKNFQQLYHSSYPVVSEEIEELGEKVIIDQENHMI